MPTGTNDPLARRTFSRSASLTYYSEYACVVLTCEKLRRASVSFVSLRHPWIIRVRSQSHAPAQDPGHRIEEPQVGRRRPDRHLLHVEARQNPRGCSGGAADEKPLRWYPGAVRPLRPRPVRKARRYPVPRVPDRRPAGLPSAPELPRGDRWRGAAGQPGGRGDGRWRCGPARIPRAAGRVPGNPRQRGPRPYDGPLRVGDPALRRVSAALGPLQRLPGTGQHRGLVLLTARGRHGLHGLCQAGAGALSSRIAGLPGLLPPGAPDGPGPVASAQGLRVPSQRVARGHRTVRGPRGWAAIAADAGAIRGGDANALPAPGNPVGAALPRRSREGNHKPCATPSSPRRWT